MVEDEFGHSNPIERSGGMSTQPGLNPSVGGGDGLHRKFEAGVKTANGHIQTGVTEARKGAKVEIHTSDTRYMASVVLGRRQISVSIASSVTVS